MLWQFCLSVCLSVTHALVKTGDWVKVCPWSHKAETSIRRLKAILAVALLGTRDFPRSFKVCPWNHKAETSIRRHKTILAVALPSMRDLPRSYYHKYLKTFIRLVIQILKQYSKTQPEVIPKLVATFRSPTASFIRLVGT